MGVEGEAVAGSLGVKYEQEQFRITCASQREAAAPADLLGTVQGFSCPPGGVPVLGYLGVCGIVACAEERRIRAAARA